MKTTIEPAEPFVDSAHVRVIEASSERAVVEQPAVQQLDNHVGVRHASALHAAAYEASRALVAAALAEHGTSTSMSLTESDISYTAVGLGLLTTTAQPSGPGWDMLDADIAEGSSVVLGCEVITTDEAGKAVVKMNASWALEPASE